MRDIESLRTLTPYVAPASVTRILLVEDDEGDAVLVRACLSEAGVGEQAVTWARTLADARAAIRAHTPDCVLLDLGLPDAAGYGAVHDIVDAVPDIAVIVLTGRRERDGMDALSAGAQDYLVKDTITGELLERSIRYAIERKRAQAAALALREAQVRAAEQARLERGLLPTPLLRTDSMSCATYYRPGRDNAVLGGDFFDVVETVDGRVRAVIGDVMGHGPPEAALGVHLRVAWRTLLLAGVPDAQILPTLDVLLAAEQDDEPRFVTACDLTFELDGTLTVRVAGHPAPILCTPDSTAYLDLRTDRPLGLRVPGLPAAAWPDNRIAVPRRSSLLLYTDGLLDAHVIDRHAGLGVDELVAAVEACRASGQPPSSWIATLVGSAPGDSVDDIAAVVLTTTW